MSKNITVIRFTFSTCAERRKLSRFKILHDYINIKSMSVNDLKICGHAALTHIPLLQYCTTNIFNFWSKNKSCCDSHSVCVCWVHFCFSPIYNQQKRKGEEKVGPHHHGNWETSALSYFAVFKSSTQREREQKEKPQNIYHNSCWCKYQSQVYIIQNILKTPTSIT